MNGDEPTVDGTPARGKQQQRGRKLVKHLDAYDTVAIEQCLVDGVVAGERAGMSEGGSSCRLGTSRLQGHDCDVVLGRARR